MTTAVTGSTWRFHRRPLAVPRATVRVQLHHGFSFDAARGLVGYFGKLGISHLYTSPILKARAGSMHGYDVVDVAQVNPELGGEPALRELSAALHATGMGLIVDIVPNHMGVGGSDNAWWQDVLESGQASPYANHFDIDWHSADPALRGKLLAPFLGDGYGEVLVSGDLVLEFDAATHTLAARYFAHRFPIAPATCAEVLANARSQTLAPLIAAYEAIDAILSSGHRGRVAYTTRRAYGDAVAVARERLAALLADPTTRTQARAASRPPNAFRTRCSRPRRTTTSAARTCARVSRSCPTFPNAGRTRSSAGCATTRPINPCRTTHFSPSPSRACPGLDPGPAWGWVFPTRTRHTRRLRWCRPPAWPRSPTSSRVRLPYRFPKTS